MSVSKRQKINARFAFKAAVEAKHLCSALCIAAEAGMIKEVQSILNLHP